MHFRFSTNCKHCSQGFRTFRQKTFQQKHVDGRFGEKNMPKCLRLKTFAETFRMTCGAYPVYSRSSSPSQRPAPTTIASRYPFPLGLCSCSTSLSKMGIKAAPRSRGALEEMGTNPRRIPDVSAKRWRRTFRQKKYAERSQATKPR